jgi:hypothetical protein
VIHLLDDEDGYGFSMVCSCCGIENGKRNALGTYCIGCKESY